MKTNGNDKTLESYKIFPYVAWIVTFLFALFVYNITLELSDVVSDLQTQTTFLQEAVRADDLLDGRDLEKPTAQTE